jgi:CRP-like cAMP-binding protein
MTRLPTRTWRDSREHDPAVLRRLLLLRQFPLFAGVDLAELVVIAENVVESTFMPGEQVAPAQTRLRCIQLVVDGRVELAGDPPRVWTSRQPLGLTEVLAERSLPAPAVATAETHTLELEGVDLFEILEENFGLLTAVLRMLATRALDLGAYPPAAAPPVLPTHALFGLVERMIVIRAQVPFLATRMQPLTMLAHAAREVTWLPGEVVVTEGEPTRDVYMLVQGALEATGAGGERVGLRAGAAIGALEVLAARPSAATLVASVATRAVALSGTAIFDVLEDHCELGLATVVTLASALLEAEAQAAGITGTTTESNSCPVPSMACTTSSSAETSTRR